MAIITRGTEPRREVEMGRVLSVAAVALLALVATACGQGSQTATTRGTPTTIEAPSPTVLTADVTTTAPGENGEDEEDEDPDEAAEWTGYIHSLETKLYKRDVMGIRPPRPKD